MPEGPLGFPRATPFGPFTSLSCDDIAERIDEVADVTSVEEIEGSCVIDFHLDIMPMRELASSIVVDSKKVTSATLRFPVLSREIDCRQVDLEIEDSNLSYDNVPRSGYCNPHITINEESNLENVIEWIETLTDMYTSEYPISVRVHEEDIDI